jgi:hypothetical protein
MTSKLALVPQVPVPPRASIATLTATPLSAYRLTVQPDPPRRRRLYIVMAAMVVSGISFLLAWREIATRSAGGLASLGIGRLADLATGWGWSFAWLISAVEFAHYGLLSALFATTVWFGATRRPVPLPNETLIFHRRQSCWVAANGAALSMAGLAAAQLLVGAGLDLLAVPVEMICISLLGAALWRALVPEARISFSVILDAKGGWGNRLILSGGMLRFLSRLTVTKERLVTAEARDVGGLEFLASARTLELRLRDHLNELRVARIRGLAPDPEIGVLANILMTRFKLGINRSTLDRAEAIGRWPVELQDLLGGSIN